MKKINLLFACFFFLVQHTFSQVLPGASPEYGVVIAGHSNYLNSPFWSANLFSSADVFVDAAGNLYLAVISNSNPHIRKLAPGDINGTIVAGGNGGGTAANQFGTATTSVFVDMQGNIFVADRGNHRVQRWAPGALTGITVAGGNGSGPAANQLNDPSDVFVDDAGTIYVADRNNHRVQKWDPDAVEGITVAGGNGAGPAANQLNNPTHIFVDPTGNIYVGDRDNHRIQKWVPGDQTGVTAAGGNGSGTANDQFNSPSDVFVDPMGSIYVADAGNYRIQKWVSGSAEGVTVAGGNGRGPALLNTEVRPTAHNRISPTALHVNAQGHIYVCSNGKIVKFGNPPVGAAAIGITIAGGGGEMPGVIEVTNPRNIFVDPAGNIYISDSANIRKWAPGASEGLKVADARGDFHVDAAGNIYTFGYSGSPLNRYSIEKWIPGALESVTVGASFNIPYRDVYFGLAGDAAGNIYASDGLTVQFPNYRCNCRIAKWTPGGTIPTLINNAFEPEDIFADANGNVYVTEASRNQIKKITPDGAQIIVAGGNGPGSTANSLYYPTSVFVDANQNVYVNDYGNNRIQKWVPGAAEGITVAGGNGQGPAANQLNDPTDIFVDIKGNLYVVDGGNKRVQMFPAAPDENEDTATNCLPNLVFTAPSCEEKAVISWIAPQDSFPATIQAPEAIDPGNGTFDFMGEFEGHGYYKSNNSYLWPSAKTVAKAIAVSSHLLTISSEAENSFIFNQIVGTGYSPWIGLSTKNRPNRFKWANGEPLSYTNWAPGEPNNYGGSNRNVTEPYARMYHAEGTWNDQSDDYVPFIAEIEKPLIRYRQISGPRNGSSRKPGLYTVCYERRDLITDKRDTCCFTVTVTCNDSLINNSVNSSVVSESSANEVIEGLQVLTSPNPSNTYFSLKIINTNREQANIKVTDIAGRVLEARSRLYSNQTVELGRSLKPGIYFVQVVQGKRKVVTKIVKQ